MSQQLFRLPFESSFVNEVEEGNINLSLSAAFSMATMTACLRGCHTKQSSQGKGFCSVVLFLVHPQGFIHETPMFNLLHLEGKDLGSNKLPTFSVDSFKEQVSSPFTSENLFTSSDVSCWCVWSVAVAIICILDGSTMMAALPAFDN
uniref:Uncharacterized protein n=1 Tax=Arundo donax TaxID=35708 RepID=A0A0A9G969_ARUDO